MTTYLERLKAEEAKAREAAAEAEAAAQSGPVHMRDTNRYVLDRTNLQRKAHRSGKNLTNAERGKANRERVLAALMNGASIKEATELAGIKRSTWYHWRRDYPEFASRCDAAMLASKRSQAIPAGGRWDDRFAEFRRRYFDMSSPWFHLRIINMFESAKPGSVNLILIPPEHGKTSIIEDYICFKLAIDPSYRITVASEKVDHAKKVLRRVRHRMEPEGPAPKYVRDFGPFAPQPHVDRKSAQPWGATALDVWKKGKHDERDYSLAASGMTSAIQGTRTDLLVIDDPQSIRSLNQTPQLLASFRQDFLSRPGAFGRTVILGTRVGEKDFYEGLMEAGILDEIVMLPALSHDGSWLWPERYTPENYERMKRNVGPAAWARNYQQSPIGEGERHFEPELLEQVRNPMRKISDVPPAGTECIIGLDPGFGTNAVMGVVTTPDRFLPWLWRVDKGLKNTQQIWDVVAHVADALNGEGHPVTDLIIENKAFQAGLIRDEGLDTLKRRFGFRVAPYQTSKEKNDPDIGVPGMARSFVRGEVATPGALDDPPTAVALEALEEELMTWRPYVRGSQLTQDLVMALFFAWVRWRQKRPSQGVRTGPIRAAGLPYAATPVIVGGRTVR